MMHPARLFLCLLLILAAMLSPERASANEWMTDFAAQLASSPTAGLAWVENFQTTSEIHACMHMNSEAPSGELMAKVSFGLGAWFSTVKEHWENLFLPRMMMCVPFALGRVTENFMERLLRPGGMAFALVLLTMTIAISMFGARLATGGVQNVKGEGTAFVLKIAFVLYWAMEGHIYVAPLFNTMNWLIGMVADSIELIGFKSLSCPMLNFGTGAMSLWYRGDCVLQQMIGVGGSIIEGSPTEANSLISQTVLIGGAALFTPNAKGLFLVGLAAIIMLLMFMFKSLFYVLYAFVLASFLMVISVFIVPLILFQKTSQYFQTWSGLVLSTVLQPAVMIAYFCFILVLIDFTLTWAPGNRFDILNIPRPQGELQAAMDAEGATGDPVTYLQGRVQRNLAYDQPLFSMSSGVDPQAYRIWEMCQDPNNPKRLGTVDPDTPGSGEPLLDEQGNPMHFPDYNACYTYGSQGVVGSMTQSIAEMLKNPAAAALNALPITVTRIFTTGAQEARTAADPDDKFAGNPEDKNISDIFWLIGNSFFLLLTSGLALVLMKDVEKIAESVGGAAASSLTGHSLSLSKSGFNQSGRQNEGMGDKLSRLGGKAWEGASELAGSGARRALGIGGDQGKPGGGAPRPGFRGATPGSGLGSGGGNNAGSVNAGAAPRGSVTGASAPDGTTSLNSGTNPGLPRSTP